MMLIKNCSIHRCFSAYSALFFLIEQRYIRSSSISNVSKSCSRCNNMKRDKELEKKEIAVGDDDEIESIVLIAKVHK